MGKQRLARRIRPPKLGRPQPERVPAHKPIVQVKKVGLRVNNLNAVAVSQAVT
jgi:hypothetical protein